jgi:hypothetical protein
MNVIWSVIHSIKKVKGKVHPVTGYEGPQALDGVDGRHTPAALPPGKRPGRS